MSTHLLKLRGGRSAGPQIAAPARAVGALERSSTPRRPHTAPGRVTAPDAGGSGPPEDQPIYWVGDERETTQGDW